MQNQKLTKLSQMLKCHPCSHWAQTEMLITKEVTVLLQVYIGRP